MRISRILLCTIALLLSVACVAQTPVWVNVGGFYNSWSVSAPATFRFGYADASGKNFVTLQVPAGALASYGNGSQVPAAAAALPNPNGLPFEVDVLQTGTPFVVQEGLVWGGGGAGCFTTVSYNIPATGAVTTSQSVCPGDLPPPDNTPPPVTTTPPPDNTPPPVTTTPPPVTTTPPPVTVTTPIGPITITLPSTTSLPMSCASGIQAGKLADGSAAGQFFFIVCAEPQ